VGKDTQKYRYLNVGLGWDSWVLSQLQADAELHQMEDQPGKLAALRLTEYYRLVEQGLIVPGLTVLSKGAQEADPTALVQQPAHRTRSTPLSQQATVLSESSRVGANANAALLAFMDD
jgi:hypothetical protein